MARANTVMDDWMDYWSNLGRGFADRLFQSWRDLGAGQYDASRLFSDAMATWQDGLGFWQGGALGRRTGGSPVVFFRILPKTEYKTRSLRVGPIGDGSLEASDLMRIGGGPAIPKSHVVVTANDLRDDITVELRDLLPLRLAEGMYFGVVHADERLIAFVNALVTG